MATNERKNHQNQQQNQQNQLLIFTVSPPGSKGGK